MLGRINPTEQFVATLPKRGVDLEFLQCRGKLLLCGVGYSGECGNRDTLWIRLTLGQLFFLGLLPQPHGETIFILNQVRLSTVVVVHRPNNSISYSHTEVVHVAVVTQDFL